jgi:hypothetical protein
MTREIIKTYSTKKVQLDWIQGIVPKTSHHQRLGISFRSNTDGVFISKIQGKFKKYTDLVPGLKLLQVDGKEVRTALEAATVIRNVKVGDNIVLLADGHLFKAKKRRNRFSFSLKKKDSFGIQLEEIPGRSDLIRIARLEGNRFVGGFESMPSVGSIVLSLNGRPVKSVLMANLMMKMSKRLTLVTQSPDCFGLRLEDKEETIVFMEHRARVIVETSDQQEMNFWANTSCEMEYPPTKSFADTMPLLSEEKQDEVVDSVILEDDEEEGDVFLNKFESDDRFVRQFLYREEEYFKDEEEVKDEDRSSMKIPNQGMHFMNRGIQLFSCLLKATPAQRQLQEDRYILS